MTTVRVTVEGADELIAKFAKMAKSASAVVDDATAAGVEMVRVDAARRAPAPNVFKEQVSLTHDRAVYEVGYDKKHWYYIFAELGTGQHDITPNTQPFMIFAGRAGTVYTTYVDHPPTAARPFLRPAYAGQKDAAMNEMKLTFRARVLK